MGQIFQRAKQYVDRLDPEHLGWFIEIGTSRNGDDGSTRTIASWATGFERKLYTVDIDHRNIDFVTKLQIPNVKTWLGSGENFLSNFPSHLGFISVLYLDNFDWDWHPERTEKLPPLEFAPNGRPVIGDPKNAILEQKYHYQELGIEMNNVNSQAAHIAQMVIAMPIMAEQSVVICDDTWYNKSWGHYSGKSGAVVPYLISQGYRVAETEEYPVYGTILTRGI